MLVCLQELWKRLEDNHGKYAEALTEKGAADVQTAATASPDTTNVLRAMIQVEQVKNREKVVNKVALEVEKEKDTVEKKVEELNRQL